MEDLIIFVTHNAFTHVTCIMMWKKELTKLTNDA